MKTFKHAKKFATMFLNAVESDSDKALKELASVAALSQKNREFRIFLESPGFSQADKEAVVDAIGKAAGFSGATVMFLKFVTAQGAAGALGSIYSYASTIDAQRKGRMTATVVTPNAMGSGYEDELKTAIKNIVNKDITIQYETDETLLGGVVIKLGSIMLDGSLKGQLRLLKDEMIKG